MAHAGYFMCYYFNNKELWKILFLDILYFGFYVNVFVYYFYQTYFLIDHDQPTILIL